MVKPYNASLLRMVDYLKESLGVEIINSSNEDILSDNLDISLKKDIKIFYVDKSNKEVLLSNNDLILFVKTMEKVIINEFPKLKELNTYLDQISQICISLNITISWALPTGLNVNQYYVDSEAIRLKPFKFRKKTFSIKVKTGKVNKRKQIRALMPNLIHSLDAASLCLILDMFYVDSKVLSNRFNFFAIHDCFAVTANNIVNLIKIIKLVYIKIYSDDSYLKRFDEGIINSIKLHFGGEVFNEKTKTIKINGETINYPDVNNVILGKINASQINSAKYPVN